MRYLPLNTNDRTAMLDVVGVKSIDDLFDDVPMSARLDGLIDLPTRKTESEVDAELTALAGRNRAAGAGPFFIGGGAYRHHIPATVDHLIQRSEFLTAYTPYQPEISQGTLQTLFEFQTQVAMLTGMDVANASMYDGSTACGEAVLMACRAKRRKKAYIASGVHPHYSATTQGLCQYLDIDLDVAVCAPGKDADVLQNLDKETAAIVVQSPNVFGEIVDLTPYAEAAHAVGALLIAVFTEPVALGAIQSPGEMGADIVVGEGQSIGVGLNFGGPYVGLFACRQKLVRQMPGRVCGETVDADGKRGYVLTLSTREQHIRREKATSNICTNSGLCTLAFSIHMSLLGEAGLRQLAMINHEKACQLADMLCALDGVELVTDTFFNEFTLRLAKPAREVVHKMVEHNVLGGLAASRLMDGQDDLLIVTATETNSEADMRAFTKALEEALS
ncbi:MAG: aminomethyl-transferring glycine dehydrogenase [Robiginitomaculum sp.]|nr:MAG: aminomethyl-transferring glycine dehydrogenase [Robiginitomaculum sp.]